MTSTWPAEVLAWLCGRRVRYRIAGTSMEPVLRDGDVVLLHRGAIPAVGDIVVARHPSRSTHVVKYVGAIDDDGYVRLDSPTGTDSRQFGRPPLELVVGRVTANLSTRSLVRPPP